MRRDRNPRRAYDQDGNVITPPTIGTVRASGVTRLLASCSAIGCGHEALVDLANWPPDVFVPDAGLHMRCTACGARRSAATRPDWPHVPMRHGNGVAS